MNERRYSGEIDRLRSPERVARLEVNRVVDLATAGLQPRSALDIGTGSGLFAEAFAARGLQIAGIDLREDMLEAARHYVPSGDFRQSHMETLPFSDSAFDLVFMGLVLHEADSLTTALKEAFRVVHSRVTVLEWPYQQAEFGPPLEHRLRPENVLASATQAGFKTAEQIDLEYLTLYRLDKAQGV